MMRTFGTMKLLFNTGDQGGAGGGSSLLNTGGGAGAGAVPPAQGASGDKGGGDKPPGNAGAGGGGAAPAWLSTLPQELQEDATLKKFTDVSTLAKSYINAQKLLGADKIPVPSQHATEEDWQNVFKKLGLPEADKYEVKFGDQATLDENFVKEFKVLAHKSGILPKQAQALADWFTESNGKAEAQIVEARNKQVTKEINDLKNEWGNAFATKLQYANNALAKYADTATLEYLGKTGLANDVRLVKLLSAMGEELFKEGKVPNAGQSMGGALTPAQAKKAAQDIIGNKDHPYHQKLHPGHKAAVQEVQELFQQSVQKSS